MSVTMNVPSGWNVQSTDSGDLVTVRPPNAEYPRIEIRTKQLGTVQPISAEQTKEKLVAAGLKEIDVKEIKWKGAQKANEALYTDDRQIPKLSTLSLYLYGTTYYTFVQFTAHSDEFPRWEPEFRRMLNSVQAKALDAEPLPGRP